MHVHAKTKKKKKKQANRQAMKEPKEMGESMQRTHQQRELNEGKQSMLGIRKGKQACYQTKEGVLGGQM